MSAESNVWIWSVGGCENDGNINCEYIHKPQDWSLLSSRSAILGEAAILEFVAPQRKGSMELRSGFAVETVVSSLCCSSNLVIISLRIDASRDGYLSSVLRAASIRNGGRSTKQCCLKFVRRFSASGDVSRKVSASIASERLVICGILTL